MDLRIDDERCSMVAGDLSVIPSSVEHEAYFPQDTEVVDMFAPSRETFIGAGTPAYMLKG